MALRIYSERENVGQLAHAMESLKKSMRWDEEVFGEQRNNTQEKTESQKRGAERRGAERRGERPPFGSRRVAGKASPCEGQAPCGLL